jgi:nicotinate-nucleotide adenylyltransferase
MSKIGIMGGTFDPIHNGHIVLGKQALKEYNLDKIWFMPTGHPPHKKDHKVTDASYRFQMVKLAIEGQEEFVCSDFELLLGGTTYTAKTLFLLHEKFPEHTFYFIIGADSLFEIEKWYEPKKVLSQAIILAADREYEEADKSIGAQIAYLTAHYNADIRRLHCREMDISSSEIRELVEEGESISDYVPEVVEEYIIRHRLYKEAEHE